MTISVSKTRTETVEVPLVIPSFWKEPTAFNFVYFRAVLDEKTFVQVTVFNDWQDVRLINSTVASNVDKIEQAFTEWESVTEEEFLEVFNKAYNSMSLVPMINVGPESFEPLDPEEEDPLPIDTGSEEAYMELAKEQLYRD